VPVYNPMLFSTMFLTLRSTCLNCHHFKMAPHQVRHSLAG